MAKHQHPQTPSRPRQGSLGVWTQAHLTVLCPANTTGYFTAEPWGIAHVLLGIYCIPNLPRADIRIQSLLSEGTLGRNPPGGRGRIFTPLQLQCLPSCQQHFFIYSPTLLGLLCFQNKHLGQARSLCSAASMEYSVLELPQMLQRLNLKSSPSSKRSVSVRGGRGKRLELAAAPTARGEWNRGSHQQLQCNRSILKIVKSFIAVSPLPPKKNTNQERVKASRLPPVLLSFPGHTSLAKHHF